MITAKGYLKNPPIRVFTLVLFFGFAVFLFGCGKSPDKTKSPAETDSGKADSAALVTQTGRMSSKEVRAQKTGGKRQDEVETENTTSSENEEVRESSLAGHDLYFYFPTEIEEENYLKNFEKSICDAETVARREKESDGLVGCGYWKANLKKAGTLVEMNISRYKNADSARVAIDRMRSTGGFIAGDVILAGDEQWPDTAEGEIEARSLIKSYYGRIRPTYVYRNEMGNPEDYLLENDRQLELLKAKK